MQSKDKTILLAMGRLFNIYPASKAAKETARSQNRNGK
ncbi:hypothetical protein CHK_2590 [Christensenella hongkongensis]|uniref:Uncharacterized protein n=2 Tax=Christensenella hongkongensis TaxID=270498 RepID=A0A0M2NBW5_9FIRM|nr:hypothetical protein CHK_2590 [Christensenella hongkongensis]